MNRQEIDKLVQEYTISTEAKKIEELTHKIWDEALNAGVFPASIHDLYVARGKGRYSGFTVPAMNLRSAARKVGCAGVLRFPGRDSGDTDRRSR